MATIALAPAAQNPVAAPEATVVSGNARFTVLTPQMVRIEYSDSGRFEDRATFAIINRRMESVPRFTTREEGDFLYLDTDSLHLKYRKGTDPRTSPVSPANLSVAFNVNGAPVEWFPGKADTANLKGTARTLDWNNGDSNRKFMEDGLVSRSGWAIIDDSWKGSTRADGSKSLAFEYDPEIGFDWYAQRADTTAMDTYLLAHGHDYKKAIGDFTKIGGKIPLPPKFVFGYWYSRFAAYSDDDYRRIMQTLKEKEIPADVIILDMDWHWNGHEDGHSVGIGGWVGWSWNTRLIPRPEDLLADIHNQGYHTGLNFHSCDGIGRVESPRYFRNMVRDLGTKYLTESGDTIAWHLEDKDFYKSFFSNILHEHEDEGVDFWWPDWQQWPINKVVPYLGETFWHNHVLFSDMKKNRTDRRPLIFHRWGGLGSHRYQLGFSGDTFINFPTLAFEPYFTATASNVGYTYWGHDLGGHMYPDPGMANNPELILRWFQFGAFSPIFRSHAGKSDEIERRIWMLPNFNELRDVVRLRYSLIPYIYTASRNTYDTGVGLVRPLYYEHPEAEEAYAIEDEYYFGDNILVAPVTAPADSVSGLASRKIWFPAGQWWSAATHQMISGPATRTMEFTATQIPYFYKAGSITPLYPEGVMRANEQPATMVLNIVAGASGKGSLYEDSGDSNDYDDNYALTEFTHNVKGNSETYIIGARHGKAADSLAPDRAWTLNIVNATAPKSVKINGKKAPRAAAAATVSAAAWSYDAATNTLRITLPSAPCSQKQTIAVDYTRR